MHRSSLCLGLAGALLAGACGDDAGVPSTPDGAAAPDGASGPDVSAGPDGPVPDGAAAPDVTVTIDATTPDAAGIDAVTMVGIYDWSCSDDPTATTAPNPLMLSGTTSDFVSGSPLSGAVVDARRRSDDVTLASATSDAAGAFSMSYANPALTPVDAYVRFTRASYATTYLYPPEPLFESVSNLDGLMVQSSIVPFVYVLAGAPTYEPANGSALVAVVDCAGTPIEGASIAIDDLDPTGGDIGYVNGPMSASASATQTDATGIGIGFNVLVGDTTAHATYMGVPLQSNDIRIYANAVTVTIVHP
jgi:hypothetical protein